MELPEHIWDYIRNLEHKTRMKDTLNIINQLKDAKREREIIEFALECIEHYISIEFWDDFEVEKENAMFYLEYILQTDWYRIKAWKVPEWCRTKTTSPYYKRLYEKCS